MHYPFDNVRYLPHASSNVDYFFVADVKCGFYKNKKNNRANATHGPSAVQCSETEPKQCWTREVQYGGRTWTWTNAKPLWQSCVGRDSIGTFCLFRYFFVLQYRVCRQFLCLLLLFCVSC